MRASRITGVAAAALLCGALAVPAGAAAQPASCDALALSPAFAKDGRALCVGRLKDRIDQPSTGVQVFLTTDRGRTWAKRAAAGLPFTPESQWHQVVFSPAYSTDRTVYVQERTGGLYRTTDDGATFTAADPLAVPGDQLPNLAPVGNALPVEGGPAGPALAYAGLVPALITPPVHRPVAGSGVRQAKSFLVPRTFPKRLPYLVSLVPNAEATAQYKVLSCDATFTCVTELGVLPAGWTILAAELVGPQERLVVVARMTFGRDRGKVVVWRSTVDGAKLERLSGLERAIRPIAADLTSAGVAGLPSGELAVLLDHPGAEVRTVPARQLLVSSRGGTAWKRVAHRLSSFQHRSGPVGALPEENLYTAGYNQARVWAGTDGRLFLLGGRAAHSIATVYCSRGGAVWKYTC